MNKKQMLFDMAEQNYLTALQSGVKSFKDKAIELYKEYKKQGGRKVIRGLEVAISE